MHKPLCAILLLLVGWLAAPAQEVVWDLDARIMLNNREGGDEYTPDQTFVFTRLTPQAGLSMDAGAHELMGGVTWYQPMADDLSGYKLLPSLYYRYHRADGWHITVGVMPRRLMVRPMPRYLWSDSLDYCQPNIRGVMAQLVKPAGYAELAVDWRQMQTGHRREAFTAMLNASWRVIGPVSVGGHAQYSHLAKSKLDAQEQHVNDDLVINPMATVDLSGRTALDSLQLSSGAIIAMERDRGDMHWHRRAGFVATATARWRWLQLDQSIYTGQRLMPLYPIHGSALNLGDPYYNSKAYSRTDLVGHIVSNNMVDLTASLAFHATDRVTGFWQEISCRFYIDSHGWSRKAHRRPPHPAINQ